MILIAGGNVFGKRSRKASENLADGTGTSGLRFPVMADEKKDEPKAPEPQSGGPQSAGRMDNAPQGSGLQNGGPNASGIGGNDKQGQQGKALWNIDRRPDGCGPEPPK